MGEAFLPLRELFFHFIKGEPFEFNIPVILNGTKQGLLKGKIKIITEVKTQSFIRASSKHVVSSDLGILAKIDALSDSDAKTIFDKVVTEEHNYKALLKALAMEETGTISSLTKQKIAENNSTT